MTAGVTGDGGRDGLPVTAAVNALQRPVSERVTEQECTRCAVTITPSRQAPVIVVRARYEPMDPGPLWPALGDWPALLAIATAFPDPRLPLAAKRAPVAPVLCQGCEAALQEWLHGRPLPARSPRPRGRQDVPDDAGAVHVDLP